MAVKIHIVDLWVTTPCSVLGGHRCFGEKCRLLFQDISRNVGFCTRGIFIAVKTSSSLPPYLQDGLIAHCDAPE
jgi:hypothetical protein